MTEVLKELLRKQLLAELLTGLQELCRRQAQNRWQRYCIKTIATLVNVYKATPRTAPSLTFATSPC